MPRTVRPFLYHPVADTFPPAGPCILNIPLLAPRQSIAAENAAEPTEAANIDHHTPSTPRVDIGTRNAVGTTSWDITPIDRACAGRSVAARVWLMFTATQDRRYLRFSMP